MLQLNVAVAACLFGFSLFRLSSVCLIREIFDLIKTMKKLRGYSFDDDDDDRKKRMKIESFHFKPFTELPNGAVDKMEIQ